MWPINDMWSSSEMPYGRDATALLSPGVVFENFQTLMPYLMYSNSLPSVFIRQLVFPDISYVHIN